VIRDDGFRSMGQRFRRTLDRSTPSPPIFSGPMTAFLLLVLLSAAAIPAHGRDKTVLQYGAGLIVNIPLSETEVEQAVEDVAQNTIIRGTKEYNKDEYVSNAVAVKSTPVFPTWSQAGKVYYKVREQAINPWNFKDSADVGTLAVRYVVNPQGDNNTVLRIDAIFVESFRHVAHASNGSVESAEYKDIQDHLHAVELVKQETAEALEAKRERAAKQRSPAASGESSSLESSSTAEARPLAEDERASAEPGNSAREVTREQSSPEPALPEPLVTSPTPETSPAYELTGQALDQHIAALRREVVRVVKKPGAPLQSAPFHTATTLKALQPGTEILVVITTPYWFGVETHDGEHGWIRRDELELAP
jgi:hypothetical protein